MPRSELSDLVQELSDFDWFHLKTPESRAVDPHIDELLSRVRKLFVELDEVVEELGIPLQPGLIETLQKGYHVKKEQLEAEDWTDLVGKLEVEARSIIDDLKETRESLTSIRKEADEKKTLNASFSTIWRFSFDTSRARQTTKSYMVLAVTSTKDLVEIKRSLPDQLILASPVSSSDSVVLVVSSRGDAERTDKVLKSFEAKFPSIPKWLSQNPSEAHMQLESMISDLQTREEMAQKELTELASRFRSRILALREASQSSLNVLERTRRAGELRRFAVLEGYVLQSHVKQFAQRFGRWLHFVSSVGRTGHGHEEDNPPGLLVNARLVKPFENITFNQGHPRYGEPDPTPIIAITFTVFYGIMFADLGQGILLVLLGLLLRARGSPSTKQWGTLIVFAGAAAAVMGLVVGEVFGMHMSKLSLFPGYHALLEIELTGEHVLTSIGKLLSLSIVLGVVHLAIGLALDVWKGIKQHESVEVVSLKAPTLVMYIAGVIFGLAFVGNQTSFEGLFQSSMETPLLSSVAGAPIPVSLCANVSVPVIVVCIVLIVFGKPVAGILGKTHDEGVGMAVIMGVVEFILRVVEFLANTISYARLGILLLVHAALMSVVNFAWGLGGMGIPIIVIGNMGVMALEGLIVYIQDLRLHIYEWFTKFYEGTGESFRKMTPETRRLEIVWKGH